MFLALDDAESTTSLEILFDGAVFVSARSIIIGGILHLTSPLWSPYHGRSPPPLLSIRVSSTRRNDFTAPGSYLPAPSTNTNENVTLPTLRSGSSRFP